MALPQKIIFFVLCSIIYHIGFQNDDEDLQQRMSGTATFVVVVRIRIYNATELTNIYRYSVKLVSAIV